MEIVKAGFPRSMRLNGLRVVIGCANGAGHKVAPTVLWEPGGGVILINNQPNGFNIKDNCGTVYLDCMAQQVLKYRADIGIALDADADRVIVCGEKGHIIDGDQLIALARKKTGKRATDMIVTTVMSNLGLEQVLKKHKIKLKRTKVGDRYVVGAIRSGGANVAWVVSNLVISC